MTTPIDRMVKMLVTFIKVFPSLSCFSVKAKEDEDGPFVGLFYLDNDEPDMVLYQEMEPVRTIAGEKLEPVWVMLREEPYPGDRWEPPGSDMVEIFRIANEVMAAEQTILSLLRENLDHAVNAFLATGDNDNAISSTEDES